MNNKYLRKENIFFIFPMLIIWWYLVIWVLLNYFFAFFKSFPFDLFESIIKIILIAISFFCSVYIRKYAYKRDHTLEANENLPSPNKENRIFVFPVLITCWIILSYIFPMLFTLVPAIIVTLISLLFAIYLREDRYKKKLKSINSTNE